MAGGVKSKVKTKTIDRGMKKFLESTQKLKSAPYVKVGFPEESTGPNKEPGGLTVATVATFNEFGTDRIPERSFIRSTVNENRAEIKTFIQAQKKNILINDGGVKQLGLIGLKVQTMIQKKIQAFTDPPNAASTIAQKGSSHPLIDTGQMVQSVRYVVVPNGGKK